MPKFRETKPEGLSSREVALRLAKYGHNDIPTKREFRALKIFISQFTSLIVLILLFTGAISYYLGDHVDAIAIFTILLVNGAIGFFQEYKADNAIKALKKLVIPKIIVIRDGQQKSIDTRDLVPGDLVVLDEGAKIPADLELTEAFSMKVDESILTGESLTVNKYPSKNQEGKLFKGTLITSGRGTAIVTSTGLNTEFGKILQLLNTENEEKSPLTIQLDHLTKKIGVVVLLMVSVLAIISQIKGISILDTLKTSVALGVSAIPEGMPIILTLTLAIGIQRLSKRKAIIRKMNVVETLGKTTIICSDKTGTLTLNEMTVKKIFTNFKEKEIPGVGYNFTNKFKPDTPEALRLLEICENCNNSFIGKQILGDPTEIALKILVRKTTHLKSYKKIDELTFTSERKMMSTQHQINKEKYLYTKGAFEEVIKKCSYISFESKIKKLTAKDINKLQKQVEQYGEQAFRVLAFAYKKSTGKAEENDLIFVGLCAMLDPPRDSVKGSIKQALSAGIKIKIITGDNPLTAKAIATSIGLTVSNVVTGDEIEKLNDQELKKLIYKTQIFARTNPQHKHRIVSILKKNGEIVAVTGDGVNDAPAIKHANIGIAMGIKGTEATKEIADIVLKDDNFSTIINAIEEGRRIYQNILSFIKYMLAANFDDIMTVGITTMLGYPLPLLPLQILWINLATDALPALALGQSPAKKDIMLDPPQPKKENLFGKFFPFIMVAVIMQVTINLILYFYGLEQDALAQIDSSDLSSPSYARTLVFTQIVIFEIFFAFVCKSETPYRIRNFFNNKTLLKAGLFSLVLQLIVVYAPPAQAIFKTLPLSLNNWIVIILASSTSLLVPQITTVARKIFSR